MTKELEELLTAFTRWLNADAALKEKAAGEEEPKKIITLHPEEGLQEDCETPEIDSTISVAELVARTKVCMSTMRSALKSGKLPIVEVKPARISTEGFDPDFLDLYRPFKFGALYRSKDLKACRVAIEKVNDPAVQKFMPVEWYINVTDSAVRQRVYHAIVLGQLHSYRLGRIGFVNMDELRNFALWWVETRHVPNKDDRCALGSANTVFCVHENDLIWSRTRQWFDQFHPDPKKVEMIRDRYGSKSREINGTRYYLVDCLQKED